MKMFDINDILRENIKKLIPYSSARNEFTGKAAVFLDANENSFGSASEELLNRYPDPLQVELKNKVSILKHIAEENIFLGNGSDEAIDLIFRAFCNPGVDNVIVCPPTYGMYGVTADVNDVRVRKVLLSEDYQLRVNEIFESVDDSTKLIFICSPNNPTANLIDKQAVRDVLTRFNGIVILDEAYIDFANPGSSFVDDLKNYPNLVILQTFSKAWGMANIRLGMAFADKKVIEVLNKIKLPYNVNGVTQGIALKALDNIKQVDFWITEVNRQKEYLNASFQQMAFVSKIYPSDANFILIKTTDAKSIYTYLVENGLIVRDRSNVELCEGAIRVTVGTEEENKILIEILKKYQ